MLTLVDRFRNATVTGFNDRALFSTVLAFLVSVKQQRGPKRRAGRSHITTPTGSIPNAYNGYLRIRTRSAAVVLATVLANDYKQHSSVYLVTIICNNCVILHILC